MQTVTTIGLDIGKSVFHSVDSDGQTVIHRRQLKRRYVLAFFRLGSVTREKVSFEMTCAGVPK